MKYMTFYSRLRALFSRHDRRVEARAFAESFRTVPGLTAWLLKQARLTPGARRAALIRGAQFFRGENASLGIADALERLADTDLFHLVARELCIPPQPEPGILSGV
jgi:hypothetical protein